MKKIPGFVLLCFLVNATYAQPSVKTKKTVSNVAAYKNSNPGAGGGTLLNGKLGAPSGTTITVQYNGKNDLVLSAPKKKWRIV